MKSYDFDTQIARNVRRANELERQAHESSGKLTASMLNWPLLEQVLKIIGVPVRDPDDYALRLFARGRQAEQFIIENLDGVKETQKEVNYRNCIGLVDIILEDGIPVEVKSCKNSAFKWLERDKQPKPAHILQATLYALALNAPASRVLYTAADDLRTMGFELPTDAYKPQVDKVIDEVETQLRSGTLPEFKPRESWQEIGKYDKYAQYPNFLVLTAEESMNKLKREFPTAWEKLRNYK